MFRIAVVLLAIVSTLSLVSFSAESDSSNDGSSLSDTFQQFFAILYFIGVLFLVISIGIALVAICGFVWFVLNNHRE